MTSRFSKLQYLRSQWVKPDVVPLIGAVATGACLAAYIVTRHLSSNPDVMLSKKRREMGIAETAEQDIAALEAHRRYQQSGSFRWLSKIAPKHSEIPNYPGCEPEDEECYGKQQPGQPGYGKV